MRRAMIDIKMGDALENFFSKDSKKLENMIKSCAMGTCIKVVKKYFWFPTEKNSFLERLPFLCQS
jgi:hypothetical protein